jgi:hypothetical protein
VDSVLAVKALWLALDFVPQGDEALQRCLELGDRSDVLLKHGAHRVVLYDAQKLLKLVDNRLLDMLLGRVQGCVATPVLWYSPWNTVF